jgi:hypothetical protein
LDDVMAISGSSSGFSSLNLTSNVQDRAQKLLQQMDSDADGKVSKQELAAAGEKMKANGPRRAELSDAAQGTKAPAPPSADAIFAEADKDGDGSLSVDDLSAMMAEHETHAAARGGRPAGAGGPPPGGGGPPPGGAPPGGAGGASGGGAAGSSSSASEDSDPADTNGDGNVSAAEELIYELSHPNVGDSTEA